MERLTYWRRTIERCLELILIVLIAILVFDVIWQVASRHLFANPSSWTEELANILLVWVALLGASLAFSRQQHLGLDVLVGRLGEGKRSVVELLGFASVALFALTVLIYGGGNLVHSTFESGQTSPSLGIARGFVYLILPLSGVFVLCFSVLSFFENVHRLRRREVRQ